MRPDISVIVNSHNQGRVAHPAMQSLFRSLEDALSEGLTGEVIVILDTPDRKTLEYFSRYKEKEKVQVEEVQFGDLGLTMNHGVKLAKGKYIFFLDADDLICRQWISKSFRYLESTDKDIFVHTEYCIVFDGSSSWWHKISSTDPDFKVEKLLENNCWDRGYAAKREVLLKYPFLPTSPDSGFGFEVRHLYCEVLAGGIEHHVIPETVYFVRGEQAGSQLRQSREELHVLRPSKLFCPEVFASKMK